MDAIATTLFYFVALFFIAATVCFLFAFGCFVYDVWQEKGWWRRLVITSIPFVGLPILIGFVFSHWTPRPYKSSWGNFSTLWIVFIIFGTLLALLGFLFQGDLIVDRHPDESAERTLQERFFGCAGTDLQQKLRAQDEVDEVTIVRQYSAVDYTMSNNEQFVIAAAQAAFLAYIDESVLNAKGLLEWQGETVKYRFVSTDHHAAAVFGFKDVLIVAFRGTDDGRDWLNNVQATPKKTKWGSVHSGFSKAVNEIWPDLLAVVRELRDDDQRIWLVGHSLGGSMAVVGVFNFYSSDLNVEGVITFGSPKVADRGFAKHLSQYVSNPPIRVVNSRDTVPDLQYPLILSFFKFRHFGDVWFYDSSGELRHEIPWRWHPASIKDQNCMGARKDTDTDAHKMNRYLGLVHHSANL